MNSEQGKIAQENNRVAANMRRRKYSLELLNLAAVRAREIGLRAAAEELGVGENSIKKHLFVTKIEKQNQGQVVLMRKANNSKYPLELKREVVRRAHELQKQTKLPIKRCYENIGRLLGVNGATIRTSFVRGEFTL
jgi:hypothetical protein